MPNSYFEETREFIGKHPDLSVIIGIILVVAALYGAARSESIINSFYNIDSQRDDIITTNTLTPDVPSTPAATIVPLDIRIQTLESQIDELCGQALATQLKSYLTTNPELLAELLNEEFRVVQATRINNLCRQAFQGTPTPMVEITPTITTKGEENNLNSIPLSGQRKRYKVAPKKPAVQPQFNIVA